MSRRSRATARHLCLALAIGVTPAAAADSNAPAAEESAFDRACRPDANQDFKPFCDYHAAMSRLSPSSVDEDTALVTSKLEALAREGSIEEKFLARFLLANVYYWWHRPLASWLQYARALSLQREMDGTRSTSRARALEGLKSYLDRGSRRTVLQVPQTLLDSPLTLDGVTATLVEWFEISEGNIGALQVELPLTPGPHTARWEEEGRSCLTTLEVGPPSVSTGSKQPLLLQCPPREGPPSVAPREEPPSLTPLAWSAGGAAIVTFLTGGVWLAQRDEASETFARYVDDRSAANAAAASDAREARNIWAGIFTGAAGACVGLGVWYAVEVVRRRSSADEPSPPSSARASAFDWRLGIAPSAGSVQLHLAF